MTRYFFDTDDGVFLCEDRHGLDLSHRAEAEKVAIETLADLAREQFSTGSGNRVAISVRDDRATVFEAEVLLQTRVATSP
jgi:hypothetical protein